MTCVEKVEFENWYNSYRGKEYNFSEEIERYCCNDVEILRCYCVEFYKKVKELCGVEPFFDAGLSMRIYKSLFMPKDTIGVM